MAMTLRLIEHALALGETGNFARAAERLGISQPTLSRNIATLETKFGVRLFDRGTHGAEPTVFGRVVLDRGAALVRDVQSLHGEIRALSGLEAGRLDIVAGPYVAEDLVSPAVARLLGERPGLRVRVTIVRPDEVGPEVLSRRHEIGLVGGNAQPPHDELSIVPLRRRRMFLACRPGHPLADATPTLAEVLKYPLVTADSGLAGRRPTLAPSIEVNSLDAAKRIARESDALLPATASILAAELASGLLVRLAFDLPVLGAQPALVRLRDRTPSPAALRFLALLRAVEDELLAAEQAESRTASAPDLRL
jgi:DNA-binding transcriptional LysR family regulator